MTRWRLIALVLGAYALGLIVTAPASLIDVGLRRASDGRLRLAEARGTLWTGSGHVEIRDASARAGIGKEVAWRVRPAALLRGELSYEVVPERAARYFLVVVSPSRIELANADISLPATALGVGLAKLTPLELTGEVQLQATRLVFERGGMRGNATLRWRGAGSALTAVSPLGDYEIRLDGDGASIRAGLRTLQGPLQLDGQGSWAGGARPEFLGTARVPPQHQQQLAPLLRLIAVERGDGAFTLQLK